MDALIAWWQGLGEKARMVLMAGAIVLLCATLFMGVLVSQDRYEVIADAMGPQETVRALKILEKYGIAHQFKMPGTLLVHAQDMSRARIVLGDQGGFLVSEKGFELFDKTDYSMTDFAQKISYQRALQGEISRTLERMEGIRAARIHLNLPDRKLFADEAGPSASVVLDVEDGYLITASQVVSIRDLVANAVERLDVQNVAVISSAGKILSGGKKDLDVIDDPDRYVAQQRLENALVAKIERIVNSLASQANTVVNVSVTLDFDKSLRRMDSVLPAAGDASKGVMTESHVQVQQRKQGSSGTSVPLQETTETTESHFEVGRLHEETVSHGMRVKKLSASVLLPPGMDPAVVERLHAVIAAAIGLDASRGDALVVYALPDTAFADEAHDKPGMSPAGPEVLPPPSSPGRALVYDTNAMPAALWLAGALVAGLAGWYAVTVRRRRRVWLALQAWLDDSSREGTAT